MIVHRADVQFVGVHLAQFPLEVERVVETAIAEMHVVLEDEGEFPKTHTRIPFWPIVGGRRTTHFPRSSAISGTV
jgi:hypothetical protein